MTENENNEVEVVTHDGPTTNDMLDNMIAGKASDVQDNFNDLMQQRAGEALDQRKVELAKDIFKQSIEGKDGADIDEFDKMGLTPTEPAQGEIPEPVDINMETGIPVDKEEEANENT